MRKFKSYTGTTVALMDDDINTDQILPSRFLSRISKKGFGECLFANWRYYQEGTHAGEENPSFILNHPSRRHATILIAGENFAGGSSREHAVWALDDYGFRVVIAGGFSDIFYNNSVKNGLLAITLPGRVREEFAQLSGEEKVTVDLVNQTVIHNNQKYFFDIDSEVKHKLVNGIDDIMETEEYLDKIADYEEKWRSFYSY